ncbi:hypothetical protein [Enterococcus sp. AZ109]|uniref:hypothetical protein n=1 Tax=Enterococcus sp. AZ109 TaxID=2774634 RepID=UPI003F686A31
MTKTQAEYRWQKTHQQYEELEALFLAIYEASTISFNEKPQKLKALALYQGISFTLIFVVPFILVTTSNGQRTELFYAVIFILLVSNLWLTATINQKKTEELQIRKAEALMRNNQEIKNKLRRIQQLELAMYHQKPEILSTIKKMQPHDYKMEEKLREKETLRNESGGTLAVISHRAKRIKKRVADVLSRNR